MKIRFPLHFIEGESERERVCVRERERELLKSIPSTRTTAAKTRRRLGSFVSAHRLSTPADISWHLARKRFEASGSHPAGQFLRHPIHQRGIMWETRGLSAYALSPSPPGFGLPRRKINVVLKIVVSGARARIRYIKILPLVSHREFI